jgi:superfamily II DNA or RNA helicase
MMLRDYQIALKGKLYQQWQQKVKTVAVAPTGAGKTVIAASIMQDVQARGKTGLFVVDRSVLVQQTIDRFNDWGIEAGAIKAGHKEDRSKSIQVASVQSLRNRPLPQSDIVLIDECHGAVAPQFDFLFDGYQDSLIAGLTATPWRLNKRESLADRFDDLVWEVQTKDLINKGQLTPYIYYDLEVPPDVDYGHPETIDNCLLEYLDKGQSLPAISFEQNKRTATKFAEAAKDLGIPTALIFDDTPDKERQQIFADYEDGQLQLLVSVGVLAVGFDSPRATVAICRRKTESLSLYIQQVGRVLRLHPDKEQAIILDFAGHLQAHGLPCDYRDFDFEDGTKEPVGEAPTKLCQNCSANVPVTARECPECGAVFPIKKKDLIPLIGELSLVPTDPIPKEKLRGVLEMIAEIKGYKQGWQYHREREWGEKGISLAQISRYTQLRLW